MIIKLLSRHKDRNAMRAAGRLNAQVMDGIRGMMVPGRSALQIDQEVAEITTSHGGICAPFKYRGFPAHCCISVNEVVCHGIPDERLFQEGDIVNVDITTMLKGWYGDQSETFLIGRVSDEARALVQGTFDCMYLGIGVLAVGCQIVQVGEVIQRHAQALGYSVVRDYCGHGIGRKFHQPPNIPHFSDPPLKGRSDRLLSGSCFTVEPMINAGQFQLKGGVDGWTVSTADGELSAQFEHTILMTEDGPEILTLTKEGPQRGHTF